MNTPLIFVFPVIQKSFFRNLVAAFFAAIILIKNHTAPKVEKTQWGSLFLRCAFGTLGILCNFYAIDHLLVADASILNKLSPFFAIIFSFLLLKEKIKPAQAMCVILAFVGCLFVVKPGFENAHLIPALIGVCGGLGAGIAYTMVRKMGTHGVKGPVIVFYFSCFSCIIVIPWIVFHYQPMSLRQLLTLLLAGLFAAGGQFTITAAYTYAPAGKISIFDYSQIIFHGGQHPLRHLKQTMLCDIRNCVFVLPVIPFNQWVFGLYLPKDSLIDP